VGRNRFRKRRSAMCSVVSAMQQKIFTLTSANCKDLKQDINQSYYCFCICFCLKEFSLLYIIILKYRCHVNDNYLLI
jgi:hypothetical protein